MPVINSVNPVLEQKIIDAAYELWLMHRPVMYDEEQHLMNPKVNSRGSTEAEVMFERVAEYRKLIRTIAKFSDPECMVPMTIARCSSRGHVKKEPFNIDNRELLVSVMAQLSSAGVPDSKVQDVAENLIYTMREQNDR